MAQNPKNPPRGAKQAVASPQAANQAAKQPLQAAKQAVASPQAAKQAANQPPKHPSQAKKTRVKTHTHATATRLNNPTAELEGLVREAEAHPIDVSYPRRNNPEASPALYERDADMDPQLVWRGKDAEDRDDLHVAALPIYIQEHIHPKAIVEDLRRRAHQGRVEAGESPPDLFADWAQELNPEDKVDFYQHQQKWTNRMILGDSLQVMVSLAEKEAMSGKVQCIYMDPPYGIKFSSNWQTSTKSRTVGDNDISREPEAIKAFRDTWAQGINSYLSYLRDRLTVARDLLTPSGSIFMQIGDENVHLVRAVMDEVFGRENFVSLVPFRKKTMPLGAKLIEQMYDFILWYCKDKANVKYTKLFLQYNVEGNKDYNFADVPNIGEVELTKSNIDDHSTLVDGAKVFLKKSLRASGVNDGGIFDYIFQGKSYNAGVNGYSTVYDGMNRLNKADRITVKGQLLTYKYYAEDYPITALLAHWGDTVGAQNKSYVVQTSEKVIQRCILMTTDPGDLVLDPTCGSGTTAVVAEQWGRRWITTDTSRVSLTLARARLMGAQFDYYLLNDSPEGAAQEMALSTHDISRETYGYDVSRGFVLERVPHVTLGGIANNANIDTIWEHWQEVLEPLRAELNKAAGESYEEWEIPREANPDWDATATNAHAKWWDARIRRQSEIDKSIADNAATEYLHDKPYKQSGVVRVTGPFTVESLSPHRIIPSDAEDEVILAALSEGDEDAPASDEGGDTESTRKRRRPASIENGETNFHDVVFENLRRAGVQNTKKGERMEFTSLDHWPGGRYVQFDGRYLENGKERKAAICIGPEYGTVSRSLLVSAAREAADAFDVLVVLGFAFEAYADDDMINIGRMPVLRARMNDDLHMADRLKTGGAGNLFVIFGEPDIEIREIDGGMSEVDGRMLEVEILGVDIFDPTSGEVKPSDADDIACWFIDTDYNEEAFFVRHAYFSGGQQTDPYKSLKRVLKAEIDPEAWDTLYTTTSRPFPKPASGRIAVKAINHYGDEVLRVFDV